MPEYLAPGVYVEETSFRAKSIEGVSTSTAAFVGPARFGPIKAEPELLTSFADYERIYGGLDRLDYEGTVMHNYLAQGVRSYFEEGGRRLYFARVFKAIDDETDDGIARASIGAGGEISLSARYPGAAGNVPVTFAFRLGKNILGREPVDSANPMGAKAPVLRGASNYDLVWVTEKAVTGSPPSPPVASPLASPFSGGQLFYLDRYFDEGLQRYTYNLIPATGMGSEMALSSLDPSASNADPAQQEDAAAYDVRIVTVDVSVGKLGQFGQEQLFQNLTFHPAHERSLTAFFAAEPASRSTALYVPLVIETDEENGADIAYLLLEQTSLTDATQTVLDMLADENASDADRVFRVLMKDGNDGMRPEFAEYEGSDGAIDGLKSGFRALEDMEDISIVAAPGHTADYASYQQNADQIARLLISHAERMRYRIAVLDSADNHLVSEVRAYRAQFDSTHAALYYPWLRTMDPVTRQQINLPPSGFVAGIYARNDVEHGVHKAPANEVVRSALGTQIMINKAQQDVLNPEGINCFRFFEGRGLRLWGARTISSDPEWKYVNLRRYFAYLERSIDKGTQWVVFMNNAEGLWAKVRQTIEDFLFNEWKSERLMGTKPAEAYFVRCDRSTMTQNDLDNGRLICLIGVAAMRPAEFVIFRIGQWTAERRG